LTGYADVESTIAAINKGEIHRYVTKPWDDNDLVVMVRQGLERRHLEQENRRLEALTRNQNEQLLKLNTGLELLVEQRTGELRGARDALAGANTKLRAAFVTSIKVFSNLVELREGRNGGHSRRVAGLAQRLAVRLGMNGQEAQEVMLAALLHDIGKIGMRDVFFTKPVNELSPEESAELKHHPVRGETALMALEQLRGVALLIRSHHERFDGLGYPYGLAGDAIPLGARILALVNDCDSLQHGSMTGKAQTPAQVRNFVQLASGKRYDPAVVAALFAEIGAPAKPAAVLEVSLRPADLKPGMVLTQDLISAEGAMLLAADYVLDENLIRQIQSYSHANGQKLTLNVRLP
jgi:response regulator RpfG family c-di-GMP phosphodiesterase